MAGWSPRPLVVRGKKPQVNGHVVLETWDAVSDGAHNSNTDLTFWNGWFYLCHQTSPYHVGSSRSRMLLWRSQDARWWDQVTVFKAESGEYRDPTFGQINGKLSARPGGARAEADRLRAVRRVQPGGADGAVPASGLRRRRWRRAAGGRLTALRYIRGEAPV